MSMGGQAPDSQDWIARLSLAPHPEGGWFRRIYTDSQQLVLDSGARPRASSIHYLLSRDSPQGFLHRNRSTILHYLQSGGPVEYALFDPQRRSLQRVVLGTDAGQSLFLEVPGGIWKGSRLLAQAEHALVAEVVLPGFDEADHAFMTLADLQRDFPEQSQPCQPWRDWLKPE